ncbi:hypothetical protein BC628DRAFT_1342597 [Trametes gibbosa]|nr:hypothetical protein BC628DRAFT_1342597 [Trametes gibbosa]
MRYLDRGQTHGFKATPPEKTAFDSDSTRLGEMADVLLGAVRSLPAEYTSEFYEVAYLDRLLFVIRPSLICITVPVVCKSSPFDYIHVSDEKFTVRAASTSLSEVVDALLQREHVRNRVASEECTVELYELPERLYEPRMSLWDRKKACAVLNDEYIEDCIPHYQGTGLADIRRIDCIVFVLVIPRDKIASISRAEKKSPSAGAVPVELRQTQTTTYLAAVYNAGCHRCDPRVLHQLASWGQRGAGWAPATDENGGYLGPIPMVGQYVGQLGSTSGYILS